jgi:PAS domain S-box-containing protein
MRRNIVSDRAPSDAKFRTLLELAPDAIVTVNATGHIVLVNSQAEMLFGYQRNELFGQPIELLVPENARATHVQHRANFVDSRRTRPMANSLELRGRRKDGSEFPVEVSLGSLEDEGDLLVISIIRDVSERRRLEDERASLLVGEQIARAEAEKLAFERAAILQQIADGVIISNALGRITFANQAAQNLVGPIAIGTSVEEHAWNRHFQTLEGTAFPVEKLPLTQAVRVGVTVIGTEFQVRRPDGTGAVVRASAAPVQAEDGRHLGAVVTLHDVTAHHELEHQKDEFLAHVSHDLKTPITAIKASIGVVLANEPSNVPAPLHRMFVNIDLAADRMVTLVTDLLELARLKAGRAQLRQRACDLRDLALRAAQTIESLAQTRGQKVEIHLPPAPVWTEVDVERIERALLNLLTNAYTYGRANGVICLGLERQLDEIIFTVADDGPGIPDAERGHVFERFYRAESEATRRNQGSGLGLPIARAMIELHGGRIWLEDTPGGGATFRIALPAKSWTTSLDGGGI